MNEIKYFDIEKNMSDAYPLEIYIGGRGIGKTYSALKYMLNQNKPFLLMRRTAQELDLMVSNDKRGEGANPFKPLNKDLERSVELFPIRKNLAGIYNAIYDEDGKVTLGLPIGYAVALNTISSIRGLSFDDCDYWVYDEFIPESHVRKMSHESDAFFNAIETINRNRELAGRPPIKIILLANSNNIYNEIFKGLNIVSKLEKTIRKNKHVYADDYRGLRVHFCMSDEKFIEMKSKTFLYRLTEGTSFYDMALKNIFSQNDFSLIKYVNIKGMKPICGIGNAYFYQGREFIYVCYAKAQCDYYKIENMQDRKCFLRDYEPIIRDLFIKSKIFFETYDLKRTILDLIFN